VKMAALSFTMMGILCTAGVRLHGTPGSRSPLVNWYAAEAGIPVEVVPPLPSRHPFQQVPFLVDDDGVEVFESGAILLYLADKADPAGTVQSRARYTKWVMWANSELDGLCFGAIPGDHRVRSSTLSSAPGKVKAVDKLEAILGACQWLVEDEFSVADVAVGSYLNYVPLFFPSTDLSARPNIASYMLRCAERPCFGEAFGEDHQALVRTKAQEWLAGDTSKPRSPKGMLEDLFGGSKA